MSETRTLHVIVVLFGIVPMAGLFLWKFVVGFLLPFVFSRSAKTPFEGWKHWYQLPRTISWARIGGSGIRHATGICRALAGQRAPRFSTLKCDAISTSKARVRLVLDFQIENPVLDRELVIDDIHVRAFERDAH